MILFFDRDVGSGVPQALRLVDYCEVHWADLVYQHRPDRSAHVADIEWLELAGQRGWLAISENKRILRRESERAAIIRYQVGIVLLDAATERSEDVLAFMLRRKRWLQDIDTEARPFAFITSLRGRPRRIPLLDSGASS